MRIHRAQLEVIAGDRRRETTSEIALLLRARWPARCAALSDAALQALVEEARALGQKVQLTSRAGIETLAHCRLVFGPPPWPHAFAWPLGDGDSPALVRNRTFLEEAARALRAEEERAR